MHHSIVRSAQSQVDELEAAKARIRALEHQLRKMGVEPTTEHAYAEAGVGNGIDQPAARSFVSGNNQITIQPGPGSQQAAAMTAGVTETVVRKRQQNGQPQKQTAAQKAQPQTASAGGATVVDDARLRMSLLELDK
jgi:hypothetical protein